MGEGQGGVRCRMFAAWLTAIVGVAVLQSVVHLAVVLGAGWIGTLVDLDRSNSIPDLASTAALAAAAYGATLIARGAHGGRRIVAAVLAIALAVLTLADLIHDGPHPASVVGWLVIAVVVGAGLLLTVLAGACDARAHITLAVAGCLLVSSFLVNGLDQYDQWFERKRGDHLREYEIVAKEGLELLGWSLVALALWDEALRRRAAAVPDAPTARASRARAASRRRVA
jgi:hypothetical protein